MPIIWWLHKRELHKCNAAVRCMRSRSTSCYACNGQSFFRAFRWCGTLIFDFAMSYAVTSDLWICLWGCLLTSRHSSIVCVKFEKLMKIWKLWQLSDAAFYYSLRRSHMLELHFFPAIHCVNTQRCMFCMSALFFFRLFAFCFHNEIFNFQFDCLFAFPLQLRFVYFHISDSQWAGIDSICLCRLPLSWQIFVVERVQRTWQ